MEAYVYMITNKVNDKKYIGKTVSPKDRWRRHKYSAKTGTTYICRAMLKYGNVNFTFQVLEKFTSIPDALIWEDYLMEVYRTCEPEFGYNLKSSGTSPTISEGMKQKLREKNLGKSVSIETRLKMGASHKGFVHSSESKSKMSKNRIGKGLLTDVQKQHLRTINTGKTASVSARYKMSISRQGEKCYRAKLTEAQVIEIITRYTSSPVVDTIKSLAIEFSISKCTIRDIVFNRSWKHIDRAQFQI